MDFTYKPPIVQGLRFSLLREAQAIFRLNSSIPKITAINIVLSTNERLAIKPARVRKCTRKIKLSERLPGGAFFNPSSVEICTSKPVLFRDPCMAMRQNGKLEASAPTDPGLQYCSSATSFCQSAGADEILCGCKSLGLGSRREGAPL
jgi:hypothetical protein